MKPAKLIQHAFFFILVLIKTSDTAAQCTPASSTCSSLARISNVTIGNINNNSTCSPAGYGNYTGTVPATNLGAGVMSTISVTCDYGSYSPVNMAVWIDYNGNAVFEASEFKNLGSVVGPVNKTVINTLSIPINAASGLVKMRVRIKSLYSASNFTGNEACASIVYGETEDYYVNIVSVPVCSGLPDGGVTNTASNTVCTGTAFILTVNGGTADVSGLSYQWQKSIDGVSWNDITGETSTRLTVSQTAETFYRRKISCSNGQFNYSTVLQVTMNPYTQCYCTPDPSNCNVYPYAGIDSVSVGTIHNASTCSPNGYADYTASVAAGNIQAGTYTPVYIKFNVVYNGANKYVTIGIDFNQNGTFEINEISGLGYGTVSLSSVVRIPFTALTGSTRMRIRVADGMLDMCNPTLNSETEDYLVNISAPATPGPNFSFYMTPTATSGNGSGLSWANAFTNLMTALDYIHVSDTLRVARGTHTISGYPYVFSMKDSVVVMGGYPNTGSPGDALRNWGTNQTILSGAGVPVIVEGGKGFTLDGFILQNVNSYPNDGGAMRINNGGSVKIKHCLFRNNYCTLGGNNSGSAIRITNSSPIISDCIFVNNKDEEGSTVLTENNSQAVFINCIFSKNISNTSTVQSNQSSVSLINCDFVINKTTLSKTISANNSTLNISNSIFFNNEKQVIPNSGTIYSIDSIDIASAGSTVTVSNTITQAYDYGNISLRSKDPKFKDTASIAGADNFYFTADDGLQLVNPCSPAMNTGSNASAAGITKDILGNTRIVSSLVDLGAYEIQTAPLSIPKTLYVNKSAVGNGSGTSWANAYTDLQKALQSCSDTIRIAAGTYYPSPDNEKKSFWLQNKRIMLGGYPNTGTPTDAMRDPVANPTILSGEIPNGNGAKSDVVIRGRTVDSTSVIDGLVITKAEGNFSDVRAAIYLIKNTNPVFRNCIIRDNNSDGQGAGLLNVEASNPKFINSIFENNILTNIGQGGAVANLNSNPSFINCVFRYNSNYIAGVTPSSGGAVYNYGSNPLFDSCTFLKNIANNWGGAMDNVNSNPVLSNCLFSGNLVTPAGFSGGNANDINNDHSSPQVFNTIFADTLTGRNYGGSIVNLNQSNPSFTKCLFKNCVANSGGICFNDNSSPMFNGCAFTNSIGNNGNICNQNYSNPLFINCIASGLMGNNGSFMYSIKSSPVIINSTFANNTGYLGSFTGPLIVNTDSTRLTISNSIIWKNKTTATGEIIDPANTTTPALMNNCITQTFGTTGVNGNLVNIDPLFINIVNPAGLDNVFYTNDDGLNLANCSPAMDMGLNASIAGYSSDIIGNQRIYNSIVDMGAYETQALPGLVTNTWTGSVNSTWENPLNWSLGILPNPCTQVIINSGTVVLSSNATIYNMTIGPGVNFTIHTGYNLIILH